MPAEPEIAAIETAPAIDTMPAGPAMEGSPAEPMTMLEPAPEPAPEPEMAAPEAAEEDIAFAGPDHGEPPLAAPEEALPEAAESVAEMAAEPELDDQGAFGGLDPDDRLADSQESDDLLEIPTFLRRQAN
jgi:hypothetical protein